jgi:hypothetical protein
MLGLLMVLGPVTGLSPASVRASRHLDVAASKKKCATKVVHGKKKRVCTTVIPRPTPTPSATPLPWKTHQGDISVDVLILNIPGMPPAPSEAEVQNALMGAGDLSTGESSAQSFYAHYGVNLHFKILPTTTITLDSSVTPGTCAAGNGTNLNEQTTAAQLDPDLAASFSQNIFAITSPEPGCVGEGLDLHYVFAPFEYSTGYVHGLHLATIKHELGHMLGLHHGGSLTCKPDAYTFTAACGDPSYVDQYGNGDTIMGSGAGGLDVVDERALGFLTESQVETVTSSGDYTVKMRADNSPGIHCLRILKSDHDGLQQSPYPSLTYPDVYLIEYQTPVSEDAILKRTQVNVLLWDESSELLHGDSVDRSFLVSSVDVNSHNTFSDAVNHVKIEIVSENGNTATLRITFG